MRSSCCCRPITRSLTVVLSVGVARELRLHAIRCEQPREGLTGLVVADHREQIGCGRRARPHCALRSPRRQDALRVRAMRATGTGASGEMRLTSPNQ